MQYFPRRILARRESGFVSILQPILASRAWLKLWISLKPRPPMLLGCVSLSQEIQQIFLELTFIRSNYSQRKKLNYSLSVKKIRCSDNSDHTMGNQEESRMVRISDEVAKLSNKVNLFFFNSHLINCRICTLHIEIKLFMLRPLT